MDIMEKAMLILIFTFWKKGRLCQLLMQQIVQFIGLLKCDSERVSLDFNVKYASTAHCWHYNAIEKTLGKQLCTAEEQSLLSTSLVHLQRSENEICLHLRRILQPYWNELSVKTWVCFVDTAAFGPTKRKGVGGMMLSLNNMRLLWSTHWKQTHSSSSNHNQTYCSVMKTNTFNKW